MSIRIPMTPVTWIPLLLLATAGCSAAPVGRPEPTVQAESRLLASVTIGQGHTIQFFASKDGAIGFGEQAPADQELIIGNHAKGTLLAEMYRSLQPGAEVPPALLEADDRFRQTRCPSAPATAPPSPVSTTDPAPQAPTFYTRAEQRRFFRKYCQGAPDVPVCIQTDTSAVGQWFASTFFETDGMVGSEATVEGTLNLWENDFSGSPLFSTTLFPGDHGMLVAIRSCPTLHNGELLAGAFVGDFVTPRPLISLAEYVDNPTVTASAEPSFSADAILIHGAFFYTRQVKVRAFTEAGRQLTEDLSQSTQDVGTFTTRLTLDCAASCSANFNAPGCIPNGTRFFVTAFNEDGVNDGCEFATSPLFTMPQCF